MYGYETVKRNKCVITIGKSPKSGLDMAKQALTQQTDAQAMDDVIKSKETANIPVKESRGERDPVKVPCYFLNIPTIELKTSFSPQQDLLSGILNGVTQGLAGANRAIPALAMIKDSSAKEHLTNIGKAFKQDIGAVGESKENRRNVVLSNLSAFLDTIMKAGTVETSTFSQGLVMDWKGSQPVTFTLSVLFCTPNGGVSMGALYPLMEASSFSGIMYGNQIRGPRGFNSAGLGFAAIRQILGGEMDTLHSLELWYDSSDDFIGGSGSAKNAKRTKIMDLFRLLVIQSVKIEKPDQLFFNPKAPDIPLYKWIKADITFSTACPIPGSIFAEDQNWIMRHQNASFHDFFGHMEVVNEAQYPRLLSDSFTENEHEDFKAFARGE